MGGLRTVKGISRKRFREITGNNFEEVFDQKVLSKLVESGVLAVDLDGMRAPGNYILLADSLAEQLSLK